jgi:conjugal transfer mating pair stabilization protein TraG
MPTYEIYTTGGGYYLYDIFNFLAMFTSGAMWSDMLTIGIVLGVGYLVVKILLTGNMQGSFGYLILLAVVGALGVGPKARVMVMDTTYPLEFYGAVDNVPFSVAFVASLTTRTSYHLTRRMETLLASPDNLVYQRHGMLFGATLMSQAARWRAVTPTVQENLVSFMENCMVDGVNLDLVDIDELTREGDLATYIGGAAPGALAYYDHATVSVQSCTGGWGGLAAELENEVTRVLQTRASARAPRTGNAAGFVDVNALTGTLEDFQNMMGLAGYDATRYLRQSMLVLALDDAAGRLIANSGNSAAMSLYQAARAESQTRASYQAIGANATKWVPLIKIAFESLYYGSFPLAMLLMMTPMAMAVAKGYFGGFVWLATWEPMSSIMHTMLMKSATGFYREHTTTLSGAGSTDVLNWAKHLGVQAVEQDVGVTAGYLMMSVPFLSFAIFFGATKMAGMATSMLNVSQGAAIDTGREASTGSLSLGTTSMNNMNANTWNTSASMDRGRSSQSLADGGMVTTNRDGSQTFAAGSAQSNVGMTATVGQAVREEVSDRASDARRQVETQSQDFTQSLTTTSSQLSDFGRSASESRTAGGDVSWTGTEDQKQSATQAWSEVEKFAETHNLSTDLAMSAIVAGTLGTPPGGLSAQLSANGSLNASSRESFESAVAASQSDDYSSTVSTLISSSERASTGMSSSQGETASNSVRSNYDDMTQQAQRLSRSTEEARTLERADAYLQSQDMAYNQQITDAVIGELQERGYDQDQISNLVNPKTTAGIQRQQEVVGEFLPDIVRDLGITANPALYAAVVPNNVPQQPLEHRPVDPNTADVSAPAFGDYGSRDANARRLNDNNFDSVHSSMDERSLQRGQTEGTLAAGAEQSDRIVGEALVERAAGVVGLGWNDGVAGAGPAGAPSQPPSTGGGDGGGLPSYQRDAVTRIVMGEAAGQSPENQAALAHVIRNRMETGSYGDDPAEVAFGLRPDVAVSGASANSQQYREAAAVVDQVFGSNAGDPNPGQTALPQWFGQSPAGNVGPLNSNERDVVIRTILGEASGESADGQAAVAHVIRNRVADSRFADDAIGVAQAPQQFSAWNAGAGGNDLVNRYGPGDANYERAGQIVDQVFGGQVRDNTGGATHYYSPAGMQALVNNGSQSNLIPHWLEDQNGERGYAPTQIGGHIFTGKVQNG